MKASRSSVGALPLLPGPGSGTLSCLFCDGSTKRSLPGAGLPDPWFLVGRSALLPNPPCLFDFLSLNIVKSLSRLKVEGGPVGF